jgi:[protein-PII] uridylyltransferase
MDIAALSQSLLEEVRIGSNLTGAARVYLQTARKILLERHRAGAGGHEIVSAYTTMVDYLIRRLFDLTSRDYVWRYPSLELRCTVAAQGGYGRGELNPHSDVDLLFLYSWKVTPYVESVAERLLYTLWDAGLEVGHATRSVAECVRLASKDMKVKTALLDSRFLCGDPILYGDLAKAVEGQLLKKNGDRFVREKLEENRMRHERYGGSVYLLEPDLKEGEGGLRDIHTALWIAKVKLKIKTLDELIRHGLMQAEEVTELKSAQDFLWRVRNELHFSSGKHQDQLTFEEQDRVAAALGFEDEGTIKRVEVFMRRYYLEASQVNRLASLIIHRTMESSEASPWRLRFSRKEIRPGVRIPKGALVISDPSILAVRRENLLDIFSDAQKHGVELSHESRELIRGHLNLIDDEFRRSAAAQEILYRILRWKDRVYETLSEMHRCGVLGAFFPEFGRLLCMVLHDLYHIYTVDQHSLRLIRGIERLKAGEFRDKLPLLTQLARETENIEILYLGVLFHDVGKGFGGGHSEIGSRMVREIAERLNLNFDDAAQLEFLVRYHLLMTHTAFRRDIEDEKLILDFAQLVGGVSNLKMLYLLTYADMQAVGPDVWNNWKASLLEDLYLHTLRVLESLEKGEFRREDRQSKLRRTEMRLRQRLVPKYGAEVLDHFFRLMPESYFNTTPEDEIPSHFELMEEFRDQTYLSMLRHYPEKEYSEMVICTKDRPGLFARITGVFAAMGLDILSARITTREDGLILDVFRISHSGRPEVIMEAGKWDRVRSTLGQVLTGAVDVARLVENAKPSFFLRRRPPKVPTVIQIDNKASDDFTVIEVYAQDRLGILFTITYGLHRLGISIHLAKISTNVDQVADVFYVTDETGGKIHDTKLLEKIQADLYQSLVIEDERTAQPAP